MCESHDITEGPCPSAPEATPCAFLASCRRCSEI